MRELSGLGIGLDPIPEQTAAQPATTMPSDIPLAESIYQPPLQMPQQVPQYQSEQLFQTPWVDNMGSEPMTVDRGVFEALSSFEPLSVRVGAIHESDNHATFD